MKDFEQKYAQTYTSTFTTQPGTRPSYIPQTTVINNNSYPVYYDSGYGGYGSMVGGHWMAYNVMRDAIMLNALMGQHNYYYGPGYGPGYGGRTTYYSQSSGGSGFLGGLIFIIVLVVIAVIVVNYLSNRKAIVANPFTGGGKSPMPEPPPLRNLKTTPMDKSKPEDWLALKPNSVVTISDTQGIADSMKRGLGVRGIDYTVRSIGRLQQLDGLSTHLFLTLHDDQQVTYLLVKIVDDLIDLGLYFEPDTLPAGTRDELVDRGALWLFQEPANPQSFQPSELRYTTTIKQTVDQNEILYEIKAQGELQCKYTEQPPRSGMSREALATIVEYRSAQQVENPEFLILEIGEQRSTSSYVQFYLGCPIKFSEVDVLPV